MEPVRLEILLDDKTLKGMRSVEGNLSGIGLYAKQVIAQLEQELATLQERFKQAMATGTNTDAQMADIQALQGVIRQLKAELQGLEEQKKKTGSIPLMGDDPAPKLNNVRMSMQQIARELPSLAMGPQMFFLAISNNIPMFTDALSSARRKESHPGVEAGAFFTVLVADGAGRPDYPVRRIREGDRRMGEEPVRCEGCRPVRGESPGKGE